MDDDDGTDDGTDEQRTDNDEGTDDGTDGQRTDDDGTDNGSDGRTDRGWRRRQDRHDDTDGRFIYIYIYIYIWVRAIMRVAYLRRGAWKIQYRDAPLRPTNRNQK